MGALFNEVSPDSLKKSYALILVGSGFGSLFFLHAWLKRAGNTGPVLIIERGGFLPHAEQIELQQNSKVDPLSTYRRGRGKKPWNFTIGFGGGLNCWYSETPRMHPSDFALKSRYGVGTDWPISYEDLERYYVEAETIMQISGDSDTPSLFPRSAPYPLPPHIMSAPDKALKQLYPSMHIAVPTGRASLALPTRAQCCASARCNLCPVDAKFTAENGFGAMLADSRVDVLLDAEVKAIETTGGNASAAIFETGGRQMKVRGDFVVLGANAIFNPLILHRSGLSHKLLGRRLNEQHGYVLEARLTNLENFGGSTIASAFHYSFLDGPHRANAAAVHIKFENRWDYPGMRLEPGRWRQIVPIELVAEDLPSDECGVVFPSNWSQRPKIDYPARSAYALAGIRRVLERLPALLAPIGIDGIDEKGFRPTMSHLHGTTLMGSDPAESIIDANLLHHSIRNLAVAGTSVFPSCPTANPSLTAAALSLRAAQRLT